MEEKCKWTNYLVQSKGKA